MTFRERARESARTFGHRDVKVEIEVDLPIRIAAVTCSRCGETFSYDNRNEVIIGAAATMFLTCDELCDFDHDE